MRLESLLHRADDKGVLPSGASESEIADAEELMGFSFPADLRESYLLHDGTDRIWIGDHLGYLMPLFVPKNISKRKSLLYATVTQRWSILNGNREQGVFDDPEFKSSPVGPVRTDHWIPEWIPITYNECGDHLCFDLAPARGGKKGQIIEWDHEFGAKNVIAETLCDLIADRCDGLESGSLVFHLSGRIIKSVGTTT